MKTIKIIDLFIEYTKPVKQPRKIKFKDKLYIYNGHAVLEQIIEDYGSNIIDLLNDEVEILEEEKKLPEKLGLFYIQKQELSEIKEDTELTLSYEGVSNTFIEVYHKINEILDYLGSKGE